jgi:hypothetical protein
VGCGTVTSAPTATGSAKVQASSGRAASAPEQRAAADAHAILGDFVPPPGAVRLTKPPKLPSGSKTIFLDPATVVGEVGYWRVPETPTAVQPWEKAHISPRFSRQDVVIGPPDWNTVYSLPALPGVLVTREMNVQFYGVGGGQTVIKADAMVSWQPQRPAAEVIPASVTAVTVAAFGPWSGNPAPVTITSAPVVRKLAVLIDGLPTSTIRPGNPSPYRPGSR